MQTAVFICTVSLGLLPTRTSNSLKDISSDVQCGLKPVIYIFDILMQGADAQLQREELLFWMQLNVKSAVKLIYLIFNTSPYIKSDL